MNKRCVAVIALALTAFVASPAFAEDEEVAAKVVEEGEECPQGMVVSGLTGGQGDVTKVCVKPAGAMSENTEDVGDPNTTS